MSIRLMTEAWKSNLPTGQKMVLLALCDNANDQGECFPSISMLTEKCSMSERSVFNHIADLEKIGAVHRKLRAGRSTIYTIDPCKFCTPANSAPLQPLHPTPANSAPLQPLHPTPANSAPPPLQPLHPTPATVAPITIKEPPRNHQEPSLSSKTGGNSASSPDKPTTTAEQIEDHQEQLDAPGSHQKQLTIDDADGGGTTLAKSAKNGSKRPNSDKPIPTCPTEQIVELYRKTLPELPGVRIMDDARKRAIRRRWEWVLTSKKSDGERRAENAQQAVDWFRDFFEQARENDFLMGRTQRTDGHANWKCDIDFLMTDRGLKQVLEKTGVAA